MELETRLKEIRDLALIAVSEGVQQISLENPLYLAHYTSTEILREILKNNEWWLSNPLFMDDVEEMRFVMLEGGRLFGEKISSCKCDQLLLDTEFRTQFELHGNDLAIATFIGCFTEHDPEDKDGRLSMWRSYASQGTGTAIVLKVAGETLLGMDESPLLVGKVIYATKEERTNWISSFVDRVVNIINESDKPDDLRRVVGEFLKYLKLYALFTKHRAFSDEREWRVAYFREQDFHKCAAGMFDVRHGSSGVEPILKLKMKPKEHLFHPNFDFEKIIHSIICGPASSTDLAVSSVKWMLETIEKRDLTTLVKGSKIPFRPRGLGR